MTRPLLVLTLALLAAPAALADGIAPFATQGGPGVLTPDGSRIVALADGAATKIVNGHASNVVPGAWGVPVATYGGDAEGVSHDGRTLVLGDLAHSWPHTRSSFLFLDPRTLHVQARIHLHGDFAFDALSPDASRLYLIQHVNENDTTRYVVRAVDTRTLRLLPGRVADRTQKSWVMEGYPLKRTTSSDGRWVYTLYDNPNNVPFVHALDTVRGVAHCVGMPATKDPTAWRVRLHGTTLSVGPWRIDTRTWRVGTPHHGGFPWWTLAFLPLLLGGAARLARWQRHHERVRRARRGRPVLDRSAVRLHDAPRDRQPEAGAV